MKDMDTICRFFAGLPPVQRRAAYVVALMQAKGVSYKEIGRRAPGKPVTKFLVSASVRGLKPWSPRVVIALESTLGARLGAFLEPGEVARLKAYKAQ